MCRVWKPERCHHCSICNRCHLCMDHHSMFHNNCIGFYNRKFYLLFFRYSKGYSVYAALSALIMWILIVAAGGSVIYGFVGLLLIVATSVFWLMATFKYQTFQNKLYRSNFTTVENLEQEPGARSVFDIGVSGNTRQVFGRRLGWLPLRLQASRPVGDGVCWRRTDGSMTCPLPVADKTQRTGERPSRSYNILVVGDTKTGKSHLVSRFLFGELPAEARPTVGAEFGTRELLVDGAQDLELLEVNLWEMSGQERFRLLPPPDVMFDGEVILYSVADKRPLTNCRKWHASTSDILKPGAVVMLVCHEIDVVAKDTEAAVEERRELGRELAGQSGFLFAEASAVTPDNVVELFDTLLTKIKHASA